MPLLFQGFHGSAGVVTDPFGASLVLLTNFDGTNGGTDETDETGNFSTFTHVNGLTLTNAQTYGAEWTTSLGEYTAAADQVHFAISANVYNNLALHGTAWTVEARLRPSNIGTGDKAALTLVQSDNASFSYKLRVISSTLRWSDNRSGSNGLRLTSSIITGANWVEVAVTSDAAQNLTMYVNGTVVDTDAPAADLTDIGSTAGFVFGQQFINDTTANTAYEGFIQAVRITKADRYGGSSYTPGGRWAP